LHHYAFGEICYCIWRALYISESLLEKRGGILWLLFRSAAKGWFALLIGVGTYVKIYGTIHANKGISYTISI
jgi:hypothetical protein